MLKHNLDQGPTKCVRLCGSKDEKRIIVRKIDTYESLLQQSRQPA